MATEAIRQEDDDYRAHGVVYRRADKNDNTTVKNILKKTPMLSWVTLGMEYEPDYFAASHLFGEKQTVLASRDDNHNATIGMCSYTSMPVHINGQVVNAGYLGELRVLPDYRNKLRILRDGFNAVRTMSSQRADIHYWYTSIAQQNRVARRLLEARLKGMPCYQPMGEMLTLAIPTKHGRIHSRFQQAQLEDIPALVEFYNRQAQFYEYSPVLTEQWLNRLDGTTGLRIKDFYLLKDGAVICACFALWDQRRIKQTVVHGYRFPLGVLRRVYNLYARLAGKVVLPKPGNSINYVFMAFAAIDKSCKSEFSNMVSTALALIRSRGADLAMLGLAEKNPLVSELDSFPRQTYRTCIEKVSWPGEGTIDESVTQAATGIVQPEIAIL